MNPARLAAASLSTSLVAIVVAVIALLKPPPEPAPVAPTPDSVQPVSEKRVEEMAWRLDASEKQLAESRSRITSLTEKVDRLSSELAEARVADPVAGGAVDPEAVREAVRDIMREQFERFRRDRGDREPGGREADAGDLKERLGIDDATATKLAALQEKMGEEIRNIWRENKGGDRDGNMKLMNEMREQHHAQLREILTDEQFEQYEQMRRDGRGRGRGRGRGPRPGDDDREERPAPPAGEAPVF